MQRVTPLNILLLLLLFFYQVKVTAQSIDSKHQKNTSFNPGEHWNDVDGNLINAHGGVIMLYNGIYYW